MVGTIEIWDAPQQLAIQWTPEARTLFARIQTMYTLEELNGGTQLTLTESGYECMPEKQREERQRSQRGYGIVLEQLKKYLE